MSEQFALDGILGQGRAIDVHEGPIAAWPGLVEELGHQVLTGAGLPQEQDRRGRSSGPGAERTEALRLAAELDDARVLSEEPQALQTLSLALPGVLQGALQLALGEDLIDGEQQLLQIDGLLQVIRGAQLHGQDRVLDLAVGGEHQDRHGAAAALADLAQEVEPGAVRQAHVEQDRVRLRAHQQAPRVRERARHLARQTGLGEPLLDRTGEDRLVLDQEHAARRAHETTAPSQRGI